MTEAPEGALPAGAVFRGEAVDEGGGDGFEDDEEDAVLYAERAFADVVEQGGGEELVGGSCAIESGDAFEVAHGEDGVAAITGALGEEEL